MYNYKINGQSFDFKTGEGVFYPTDTSELLLNDGFDPLIDAAVLCLLDLGLESQRRLIDTERKG